MRGGYFRLPPLRVWLRADPATDLEAFPNRLSVRMRLAWLATDLEVWLRLATRTTRLPEAVGAPGAHGGALDDGTARPGDGGPGDGARTCRTGVEGASHHGQHLAFYSVNYDRGGEAMRA